MTRHVHDKLQALDRIRYLLEERSFQQLALRDDEFATFIETLYARLDRQMAELQSRVS